MEKSFRFVNSHRIQDTAEPLRVHEMYVRFIDHKTYCQGPIYLFFSLSFQFDIVPMFGIICALVWGKGAHGLMDKLI